MIHIFKNCNGCKGVNDEDSTKTGLIYVKDIDMSKQGENKQRLLYYDNGKPRDTICVDRCIKDEILWLLNQGVQTRNSCCGHGTENPSVLIRNESIDLIQSLGYEVDFDYNFVNYKTMKLAYLKGKDFKS